MKHLFFIQSISFPEYSAGVVLYDWIETNFDTTDIVLYSDELQSFESMKEKIESVANNVKSCERLVICIDAHSDENTITFKDKNSFNKEEYTEYKIWNCFNGILESLYNKYGNNALIIFVSCRSASYFSTLNSPHIPIIAAEGEINAMRAKEQLSVFYDEFCQNNCSIEKAYNAMVQKFPLEEERRKEENYKAVFKLLKYSNHATPTT